MNDEHSLVRTLCVPLSRRFKMQRRHLLILCCVVSSLACSARPAHVQREIQMPGVLIQARGDVKSADELFEEGLGALQGQLFERCELKFRQYLKYFSQDTYIHAVHYNLGLCLELQRKHASAATQFRTYAERAESKDDRLDGEVRLGYNLIFSAQYPEAKTLYTRLLTTQPLKGLDRAECHLRRSMAHTGLGHFAEADQDLSLAMSHTNSILGPHRQGNEMLAEVYFQRGEVYRQHMGHIELKMPLRRLKRNLTDKKRFFRKSLYAFVESIKVAHTYWAIAAGHQLGVLHEDIYEDLMQAEPPPEFDEETLAYYYFKLEERIAPLIRESISIYERTVTISATQGAQNDWVKSTQKSLRRLRDLEEQIQKRLVMEPMKAYHLRKLKPLNRGESSAPLPPIKSSHTQPRSPRSELRKDIPQDESAAALKNQLDHDQIDHSVEPIVSSERDDSGQTQSKPQPKPRSKIKKSDTDAESKPPTSI